MNDPEPMLTPQLARRIAEIRACDNISELHIIAVDSGGARGVVLLVPRTCGEVSTDTGWRQPKQPFLMMIDPAVLPSGDALH